MLVPGSIDHLGVCCKQVQECLFQYFVFRVRKVLDVTYIFAVPGVQEPG